MPMRGKMPKSRTAGYSSVGKLLYLRDHASVLQKTESHCSSRTKGAEDSKVIFIGAVVLIALIVVAPMI